MTTGKEIGVLPLNSGFRRGIAFSPDHKRVAVGNDSGELVIWDTDTGRETLTLPRSSHAISGANFSPDGRRLEITYGDCYARAWLSDMNVGAAKP